MPVTDAKTIRTVCNSTSQPLLRIGTPRSSASLLSARTEDIGQTGDESWTVLADSEGSEFCVVRPWTTLVV